MQRYSTVRIPLVQPSERRPRKSSLTTTDPPTIDASEVAAEYQSWYLTHEYPPKNISPEQKEHWMKWKMGQLEVQNLEFATRIRSLQKRRRLDEMELGRDLNNLHKDIVGWVCFLPHHERLLERWPAVNQYLVNLNAPSIDEEKFSDIIPLLLLEFITFAISSLMWKTLCAPILIGASPQQRDFLERIQKAIELFERKKSPEAMAIWRSDTCEAIATFNEYPENLAADCQVAVDRVIEMLKVAGFSEQEIQTSNARTYHQVMAQRMAEIATKLQCNPTPYIWRWDFPSQFVRKDHLEEIALYDPNVNTTVLDPFESYGHFGEHDIIGYSIFTIFPTLIKVERRGDFWGIEFHDIEHTISNGWVIVDLDGGHPGIDVPNRIEFPPKYSIRAQKALLETEMREMEKEDLRWITNFWRRRR